MLLRVALVPLVLLVAGCVDPYSRRPPDQVSSDEWTLEPGSFYQPSFETAGKAHVRAHVTVLSGEPIDAFLAGPEECLRYPAEGFRPAAELLSVVNGTMDADLPGGQACLVLDNHDGTPGASPGRGTVRVAFRIEVWNR